MVDPQPSAPKPNAAPDVAGAFTRAMNLILKPEPEWEKIAGEKTALQALFVGYVAPLAAIPAVAGLIGAFAFGFGAANPGVAATQALLFYALTFAEVYVLGLFIDFVAEYFDARRDRDQSMKLAVYSHTPMWVAGIFSLVPQIGLLAAIVGAAYGAYLLFRGIPPLMKTNEEKALGYAAAVVGAAILLSLVAFSLNGCLSTL